MFPLIAIANSVEIGLPVTFGLAAVALIGYLFGNRTRAGKAAAFDDRRQQETCPRGADRLAIGNDCDAIAAGSCYSPFTACDVQTTPAPGSRRGAR